MSADASSVQILFPTYRKMDAVSPHISSKLSNTTSVNPTTKLLIAPGMIAKGDILDAPKATELGIPEVEFNLVQTVKGVHMFWKLITAQRVADLDIGWRDSGQIDNIFVLQDTNNKEDIPPDLLPILEEYAGTFEEPVGPSRRMEQQIQLKFGSIPKHHHSYRTSHNHRAESAVHNAKLWLVIVANGQKLFSTNRATVFKWGFQGPDADKASSTIIAAMSSTSVLVLPIFLEPFILETDVAHAISTIMPGFFLGGTTIVHLTMALSVRIPNLYFYENSERKFKKGIGTKFVPMLKYLEDDTAGAPVLGTRTVTRRVNTILQSFEGIQLGIMLVVESGAAFLGCKTQTSVQELSKVIVDGNFKIEPSLVRGTRILNRDEKKFGQMLLHGLKARLESAIWEVTKFLHRKISPFDPCGQGSFEDGGIVMAIVKEKGKEVEVADGKEKKLGQKANLGKKVGEVIELEKKNVGGWLISESAFAMSGDFDLISGELPSLDPRGRGSSAAGGIVMYCEGGKESVKANRNAQLKKKVEIRKNEEEEKLDSGADLGKKGRWTWATQITMLWTEIWSSWAVPD